MLAEPSAAGLAQGSSGKQQRETDADGRFIAALRVDQKRQKQQVSHARRGIQSANREEQTEGICAVGAVLKGVSDEVVAVSVPVPAQRFYRREAKLAQALLAWVDRVNASFA